MQERFCHASLSPTLTGYWQSWNIPGGETLPLVCVPCTYTDVIIAFVAPDDQGDLLFVGPNIPTQQDVCCMRLRGQNVLLSIGGGGVTVALDTEDKIRRFADSLYAWILTLGVNGIDIDIEQGLVASGSPDHPEGTTEGLIRAVDSVLSALPPGFMLTLAPETIALVGGISRFGGAAGSYLPLILHFGDRITRVHMQYYNSGPMVGLDGRVYEPGTVDFVVAMTDAVIQGFPIAGTNVTYEGLPPWKVSIGLPASPQAASNGYLAPNQVNEALYRLRTGKRAPGQWCPASYRHLGGLMTWSIQWDIQNNCSFSNNAACAITPVNL